MSLLQLFQPLRIGRLSQLACQCASKARFARESPFLAFTRNATSLSQGRANGAKNGPGKRLGAKKGSEEYVIPGNIIFRQRGTLWHPGENCAMGRDHTIYATEPGYVRFYKDPARHPKRRYIGVALDRSMSLPTPRNAPRRRRLGMLAVPMAAEASTTPGSTPAGLGSTTQRLSRVPKMIKRVDEKTYVMRPDYSFRQGNWEIGRAAEKAKVKVKPFKPGDRFAAWRKANKRKQANAERKTLRRK